MKVLAYTFLSDFRTILGKRLHTFNETSLDNFKQFPVSSFIFLLENVIFPIVLISIVTKHRFYFLSMLNFFPLDLRLTFWSDVF